MKRKVAEVGQVYIDKTRLSQRIFTVLCLGNRRVFIRWEDNSEGAWPYEYLGLKKPRKILASALRETEQLPVLLFGGAWKGETHV